MLSLFTFKFYKYLGYRFASLFLFAYSMTFFLYLMYQYNIFLSILLMYALSCQSLFFML